MKDIGTPALEKHQASIRSLAAPGGPLSPASGHATIRNPAWFRSTPQGHAPRAARARLHARLIDEYIGRSPRVAAERRVIVLAGPPGAGKSTVLREILGDESGWMTIDADDFKVRLLEAALADDSYDSFLKPDEVRRLEEAGEPFFPLELASLVHEESSDLAKRVLGRAISEGWNIVVDTVLADVGKALSLGERLRTAGYRIDVVDVEVSFALSAKRIAARWQESRLRALGGDDTLGGRWVPSEYGREVFDGPDGRSRPEAAAERLATSNPSVLRFRRFRTLEDGGERVQECDLARTSVGAPLTAR